MAENDKKFEILLKKSFSELLKSQKIDTKSYLSNFQKIIQSKKNPPLESIWVYLFLQFSNKKSEKDTIFDKISILNNVFNEFIKLSASCSSYNCIVLLAPFIYELYNIIVKGNAFSGNSKTEKKVMKKIQSFINSVLKFISVCCEETDENIVLNNIFMPLEDLISIWIRNNDDDDNESLNEKDKLKLFFPVFKNDDYERLNNNNKDNLSDLVGVVLLQVFLLRLCLDLCFGVSEHDLKIWAVGSITQFRNFYFFDTLVRMLLEHTLPVTSLLSTENEAILRKVLFDAVILVEYSFLNPEKMIHVSAKRGVSFSILRVLVTYEATELFRKNGDHTKALAYMNAFSRSQLPSQLVKVVSNSLEEAGQPTGMSPKAILMWLHNLENQGIGVLDDSMSKFSSRLPFDTSEAENKISKKRNSETDVVFYIDNKGDNEDEDENVNDSVNAAFLAAASTMKLDENGKDRKRKPRKSGEKKRRTKFQKHELYQNSEERPSSLQDDELSSASEFEDH